MEQALCNANCTGVQGACAGILAEACDCVQACASWHAACRCAFECMGAAASLALARKQLTSGYPSQHSQVTGAAAATGVEDAKAIHEQQLQQACAWQALCGQQIPRGCR